MNKTYIKKYFSRPVFYYKSKINQEAADTINKSPFFPIYPEPSIIYLQGPHCTTLMNTNPIYVDVSNHGSLLLWVRIERSLKKAFLSFNIKAPQNEYTERLLKFTWTMLRDSEVDTSKYVLVIPSDQPMTPSMRYFKEIKKYD